MHSGSWTEERPEGAAGVCVSQQLKSDVWGYLSPLTNVCSAVEEKVLCCRSSYYSAGSSSDPLVASMAFDCNAGGTRL